MPYHNHQGVRPTPGFQPTGVIPHQPPPGQQSLYQNTYTAVPPYQDAHYPPPNHQNATYASSYHPRVGFIRLPSRFHIWNVMTSGGTSCLELGPQLKGPVAYSAKMFSSSRLKIKEGPYQSATPPICTIESRHTFSSKSTISFGGFQWQFKEKSEFII